MLNSCKFYSIHRLYFKTVRLTQRMSGSACVSVWKQRPRVASGRHYTTTSAPVSILPSTAAGPSSTRLLICRNSSGSSPPTTVKPKPRRLFFSLVLMKVPVSSAGFRVKNGFPPADNSDVIVLVRPMRTGNLIEQSIDHYSIKCNSMQWALLAWETLPHCKIKSKTNYWYFKIKKCVHKTAILQSSL